MLRGPEAEPGRRRADRTALAERRGVGEEGSAARGVRPSATGADLTPSPQRSERRPLAARAAPAGGESGGRSGCAFVPQVQAPIPAASPVRSAHRGDRPSTPFAGPASSCAPSGPYPGEPPAVRTCPGRGVAGIRSRPGCLRAIDYQLLTLPGPPFPAQLRCKGLAHA